VTADLVPTTHAHLTADEVLYALAGCRTVDLSMLSLQVITGTHTPATDEPARWPYIAGEILVVDHRRDSAELLGTRNTGDWDTGAIHQTTDLREAVALSALVRGGAERGVYTWDGTAWRRPADQVEAMRQRYSIGCEFGALVGDSDGENTHLRDIAYPGRYTWPTTPEATP
jgi:hypothetical protein